MCEWVGLSTHICFCLCLFFGSLLVFVLSYLDVKVLLYLILLYCNLSYYYILEAYLFSNKRQETSEFGWEGRCIGAWRSSIKGSPNKDILCEKYFQLNENKSSLFPKWDSLEEIKFSLYFIGETKQQPNHKLFLWPSGVSYLQDKLL